MADFREGLESAAALIETQDPGLFGGSFLKELAAKVRSIQPPASDGALVVVTDLDAAFRRFAIIYAGIGGHRNPQSPQARGWSAAKVKFMTLIKKQKHDPEAIISGTMAYAMSNPDKQFVPAPEVFLNKERFLNDWSRATGTKPAPTLYDAEDHFVNRLNGR